MWEFSVLWCGRFKSLPLYFSMFQQNIEVLTKKPGILLQSIIGVCVGFLKQSSTNSAASQKLIVSTSGGDKA